MWNCAASPYVKLWHCAQIKTTLLSLYMTLPEVWIRTAEKDVSTLGGWTATQCNHYLGFLSSVFPAHLTINFNDPQSRC